MGRLNAAAGCWAFTQFQWRKSGSRHITSSRLLDYAAYSQAAVVATAPLGTELIVCFMRAVKRRQTSHGALPKFGASSLDRVQIVGYGQLGVPEGRIETFYNQRSCVRMSTECYSTNCEPELYKY